MVLTQMKNIAESNLGQTVTDAVITVPAYFNNSQRQSTKDAGAIAGLNVLRIINEPTAAAIAYGLNDAHNSRQNILVFDLGGGTFDVSILNIDNGVFEVKATAGNTHLGGEDFDNRLVDHFVREFKQKKNMDISNNKRILRRLRTVCELAKRTLSFSTEASIEMDSLDESIDFTISRACFEGLCGDLFKSTLEPVKTCLQDAGLDKTEIHEVVLVGGSSRIPKVQKLLQQFFGGKALNKTINPDEAVAYGAAVQAAILNGDKSIAAQNLLVLDVTPLSLGIAITYDRMSVVIPRNTPIPTKKKSNFETAEDFQTAVRFAVYQGERPLCHDNHFLESFTLTGIRPARRGEISFDVCFEIDANGILKVSAMNKETGKTNQITIIADKHRLSRKQIRKMVAEAKFFREVDKEQSEIKQAYIDLVDYGHKIKDQITLATANQTISQGNAGKILCKVKKTLKWADANMKAEKSEFVRRKLVLQRFSGSLFFEKSY